VTRGTVKYGYLFFLPPGVTLPLVGVLPPVALILFDLLVAVPGPAAEPVVSLVVPPVTLGAAALVPSSAFTGTGGPSMVGSTSKLLR
jgi:hypothetical protein